jgi:cysteinyl-tRNA synthetase
MTDPAAARLRRELSLYNTLGYAESHFEPADGRTVLMYVCGPTVYSSPHIGNMRTYLFSDVLRRVLALAGYELDAVMNITDVGHLTSDADAGDDKMAAAAAAERTTAWDVAAKYTAAFDDDVRQLNITPMTHVLKATDHIPQQIELIRRLEEKGVVYRTGDGMYFDTSLVPDYGKLTPNDDRESLLAGVRVDLGDKRHPTDFALWKFTPPDAPKRDMEWDSPWGVGFPGWHIECSAMAMDTLGDTLDIHVGGIDHIAIHHTNEIAQSETATGQPFSRWWMHGAFLTLEGERRMGKSEGNKITLETLVEWGFDPLDFRYLNLLSHYRSPLTFSREILQSAAVALGRLRQRVQAVVASAGSAEPSEGWQEHELVGRFVDALADDLNLPRAVTVLGDVLRADLPDATKVAMIGLFDQVLGLDLLTARDDTTAPPEVVELAERRLGHRRDKDWAEADRLRDEITTLGWTVEDDADGFRLTPLRP